MDDGLKIHPDGNFVWVIDITCNDDNDRKFSRMCAHSCAPINMLKQMCIQYREIIKIVHEFYPSAVINGDEKTITFGDEFIIYAVNNDLSIRCSCKTGRVYYNNIQEIMDLPVIRKYFAPMLKIARHDDDDC